MKRSAKEGVAFARRLHEDANRCRVLPIAGAFTGLVLCAMCAVWVRSAAAQEAPERLERLAIFLDCDRCDESYIRQEMGFVDYVRDRESADVHVLVTTEDTGSGGEAFSLHLIGRGRFQGIDLDATYASSVTDSEDEERSGFLRTLQVALSPYLLQTSLGPGLVLSVQQSENQEVAETDDPWNGWTIELYGDASGDLEASRYSFDARYGVFADKVTEAWKIRLRPYFNYNLDRFERAEETITSKSRRDGFDGYAIKSITDHWSAGLFADLFSSTFDNVQIRYRLQPAVEYSVFPYAVATRRELTFAYMVGVGHVTYRDTTIFGEIQETLPQHAAVARYEVTQPWGEIDVGMEAFQYLHDTSKYRLEFDGEVDVRLFRGLSVSFGGEVEIVHDQLNLAKGDASLEEVLLRQRQLATDYEARFSVGFRYRFGSIYNNVVNTRF